MISWRIVAKSSAMYAEDQVPAESTSEPGAYTKDRWQLTLRARRSLRRCEWGLATGRELPEGERVCLGAWGRERDLQYALADRLALAHELVQAAVAEQAGPVLVDIEPV